MLRCNKIAMKNSQVSTIAGSVNIGYFDQNMGFCLYFAWETRPCAKMANKCLSEQTFVTMILHGCWTRNDLPVTPWVHYVAAHWPRRSPPNAAGQS
jgi:hypothetical protein